MCLGAIGITYTDDESPWSYFYFTFFLGGTFATRLWSALFSLELVILVVFGPNFATIRWLLTLLIGWGLVTCRIYMYAGSSQAPDVCHAELCITPYHTMASISH